MLRIDGSRSDLPYFKTIKPFIMREPNGQKSNNSISPGVTQSLQTIHQFLDNFPPEELDKQCWELVHHAFASEEADSWSKTERCPVLFLYEELRNLGLALTVIDKELGPLFSKEN